MLQSKNVPYFVFLSTISCLISSFVILTFDSFILSNKIVIYIEILRIYHILKGHNIVLQTLQQVS